MTEFNYSLNAPTLDAIKFVIDEGSGITFFKNIKQPPKTGYLVGLKPNVELEGHFKGDPDCHSSDYDPESEAFGFKYPLGVAFSHPQNPLATAKEHYERGHVGIWIKDDILFIENVKWIDRLEDAIQLAKKTRQVAIYDIKRREELYYSPQERTYN